MSWWDSSERLLKYPFVWYRPGDRVRSRITGQEFVVVEQIREVQVRLVPAGEWYGLARTSPNDIVAYDSGIFELIGTAIERNPSSPEEIEAERAAMPEVPEL